MHALGTEPALNHGHLQVQVQEEPEVGRDLPEEGDVSENDVIDAVRCHLG